MQNLFNIKKTLIALIIVTTGALGGYYFVFSIIKARNENVSILQQKALLDQKRQDIIQTIRNTVNVTGGDIEKLNSFFVPKEGVPGFIDSIEILARSNKLQVSVDSVTIDSGAKINASGVEILHLTLNVTGQWGDVFGFLFSVENMPTQTSITLADLSNTDTVSIDPKKKPVSEWKGTFFLDILKLK